MESPIQTASMERETAGSNLRICDVCGRPVTDSVYAQCERCGAVYHVLCLKKGKSSESCRNHHLVLHKQSQPC